METCDPLDSKVRSDVKVKLRSIREGSGAARVRAEEASPSDEEVNNLHMKSETTCPSVRCMRAKRALE